MPLSAAWIQFTLHSIVLHKLLKSLWASAPFQLLLLQGLGAKLPTEPHALLGRHAGPQILG
jgi:hypothetical protein